MNDGSMSTERIWELLNAKLRGFFLRRVSDEQFADDLLQETFLRIHQKLNDLDDEERLVAWVFHIARNLLVDHYRSKARVCGGVLDDLEAPAEEEANLNELVMGWLTEMIAQLPAPYREAVELYELKGTSQQEIANQIGTSLSGAKSRVQRGRAKLKELLLDCCSFEQDLRGNVIGYVRNNSEACEKCQGDCGDALG